MTTPIHQIWNVALNPRHMGSSNVVVLPGINLIGNVIHNNIITITDSSGLLGTRENIKPLSVFFGNTIDTGLGRDSTNRFYSGAVIDTNIQAGSLPSSVRSDIKQTGLQPTWGTNTSVTTVRDPNKPYILYVEKYYDFDFVDPYYNPAPSFVTSTLGDNTNYTISINGSPYTIDSGTGATNVSILNQLTSLINSDVNSPATADNTVVPGYIYLIRKLSTNPFTYTASANITIGGVSMNWKKFRTFSDYGGGNKPNTYFGANGFSFTEYQNWKASGYYFTDMPLPFQWLTEEYIVVNSSAVDVPDADIRCYVNGVYVNAGKNNHVTRTLNATSTTGVPYGVGVHQPRLDQVGFNGAPTSTIPATSLNIHLGLLVEDDEYNGVYVGDTPMLTQNTKLIRLPQTSWLPNSVSAVYVETQIPTANAYFYIRTGVDSWRSLTGVR